MSTEQFEFSKEGSRRAPARTTRAKRSRSAAVIAGALVALLVMTAGVWPRWRRQMELARAAEQKRTEIPTVQVTTPKQPPETSDLTLPGTTQAIQEAVIAARANGFVKRWLVDLGARVRQGQLLAEIDTPEVDQQL